MKINLVDDTALIETTSTKNVHKKERTILGLRHNNASNTNVDDAIIKTQQPMRNAFPKKRSSLLHVCGNVTVNQENGNVGFTEKLKFQETANMGFHVDAKLIMGCSLKKQECCQEDKKMIQEKVCGIEKGMLCVDKNQEKNVKTVQVWVPRGGKVQDKAEIVATSISYSRKQMEDLRFVNIEDQKKKWAAIYRQLGPAVIKEYDALLDCDHHLQLSVKKKVTARGILGPMAANGSWNHRYPCAPKKGLQ
ncbi:hypothetical protein AgCh_032326 [Apium graveolens]